MIGRVPENVLLQRLRAIGGEAWARGERTIEEVRAAARAAEAAVDAWAAAWAAWAAEAATMGACDDIARPLWPLVEAQWTSEVTP
jgi:hypothetical protein